MLNNINNINNLFAFGLSVKEIFSRIDSPKTHIYLKNTEPDPLLLGANTTQVQLLNQLTGQKFDDFNGLRGSEFFTDSFVQRMCLIDRQAITSSNVQLFTEEMKSEDVKNASFKNAHFFELLSIKTKLTDSANHIVGLIGISFELNKVGFSDIANNLNKLNLKFALSWQPTALYISQSHLSLSPREKECVLYLARGMTAKEIGRQLKISSRTVERHLEHIKNKLGCPRRSEIINKFLEEGLFN